MKEKLFKAYTAAWKWPEVYTTSPSIIWISRAIAVLIPVGLIALTFLTGIPAFGLAKTLLVTAIIAFVIVLTTIKIFYQEYETVEDFASRETRIKEFFHGFPSITDVPLIELERNEWVAFGHIPPKEFVTAIGEVIIYASEDHDRSKAFEVLTLENSVGHLYASFKFNDEEHWSEGLDLCKPTAENCFPITRLEL
jgi:hypothetical protein